MPSTEVSKFPNIEEYISNPQSSESENLQAWARLTVTFGHS